MPADVKGRPTLYRGIRMRSRLEADFAGYLDRIGEPWIYEPECFADETGQWLPDFGIVAPTADGRGRPAYVELKPAGYLFGQGEDWPGILSRANPILQRMTIAWQSAPNAALLLVGWTFGSGFPDFSVLALRNQQWMAWDAEMTVTPWPQEPAS